MWAIVGRIYAWNRNRVNMKNSENILSKMLGVIFVVLVMFLLTFGWALVL